MQYSVYKKGQNRLICCISSTTLGRKVQSALQHLLVQQHQSQRLKETEQTDKEDRLCAGDCSGAPEDDGKKKNSIKVHEHKEQP